MARILLHDQRYKIGGPSAVLKMIENSSIGLNNDLIRIEQTESCGFNIWKALKFILHYRMEINKYHADSIYICGLQYVGFLMTISAKLSNVKKIVLSVHGSEWDYPEKTFRKMILMYLIEPIEVILADSVFTVCDAAQARIKALRFARNGHNEGVIYNTFPSVDFNLVEGNKIRTEFGIPNNKIIVAVVGRVVEDKGHAYIIEAIKCLQDDSFVFIIVGTGDYIEHYSSMCKEEICQGKVILTKMRNDVNCILKDADIFLFATLHENHSIALLEAVNMNCAVLCTNVGGNPEIIIDGKGGILMPKKDSKAIVSGLVKLKKNELREKYCKYAKTYSQEKFSVESTIGKLEKILVQ